MSKGMRFSPTFRLFSLPGFLEGVGSVIDLSGMSERYNEDETPEEADAMSLRADWRAIGRDMRIAFRQHGIRV